MLKIIIKIYIFINVILRCLIKGFILGSIIGPPGTIILTSYFLMKYLYRIYSKFELTNNSFLYLSHIKSF